MFYGCTSLTNVSIPSSVIAIGQYAFYGCTSLTSISIPSSITRIESSAFVDCTSLTDIYALRTEAEEYNCDNDAFHDILSSSDIPYSTATLHVPKGSKQSYATCAPWRAFRNIVEEEQTPVNQVLFDNPDKVEKSYYSLQGQRLKEPQLGIVIVRYSDGTSRKILVK